MASFLIEILEFRIQVEGDLRKIILGHLQVVGRFGHINLPAFFIGGQLLILSKSEIL